MSQQATTSTIPMKTEDDAGVDAGHLVVPTASFCEPSKMAADDLMTCHDTRIGELRVSLPASVFLSQHLGAWPALLHLASISLFVFLHLHLNTSSSSLSVGYCNRPSASTCSSHDIPGSLGKRSYFFCVLQLLVTAVTACTGYHSTILDKMGLAEAGRDLRPCIELTRAPLGFKDGVVGVWHSG
jgi:hypothetical protein